MSNYSLYKNTLPDYRKTEYKNKNVMVSSISNDKETLFKFIYDDALILKKDPYNKNK